MAEDPLDRLGAFDAVMWGIEQDPLLRSVIVAMVVLEREPDVEVLLDRVRRMTHAVPRLRQRVIGTPVSLLPPRWEDDPNFDLAYHLRRVHVRGDGTDRPLLRVAEQMAEQDFDRDRPLWEIALVQGFDGDRTAIIAKLHHAISDGMGGVSLASALFDLSPDPGPLSGAVPPEAPPGPPGVAARAVGAARYAARTAVSRGRIAGAHVVGVSARALSHPLEAAAAGSAFAQSTARLLAPATEPLSRLMHGRSLSGEFAVLQVPFQPLKEAGRGVGATLNDTYMAAVVGGIAGYHEQHNAPTAQIRVSMPISMRAGSGQSAGNRWVPARFPLPVDSGDPVERIRRITPILDHARSEPALAMSDSVYRLLAVLPRRLTTSISAAMLKGVDVAVTNVPGPPTALFAGGAAVQAIVPFAPRAGAAANIALFTYHGTAYVGANVDTRAIPNPGAFVGALAAGFEQVLAVADPAARVRVGVGS